MNKKYEKDKKPSNNKMTNTRTRQEYLIRLSISLA